MFKYISIVSHNSNRREINLQKDLTMHIFYI